MTDYMPTTEQRHLLLFTAGALSERHKITPHGFHERMRAGDYLGARAALRDMCQIAEGGHLLCELPELLTPDEELPCRWPTGACPAYRAMTRRPLANQAARPKETS